MERKEMKYKGYWVKPIYKHKWAVYQEGPMNANVPGGRCGTIHSDIRISTNFSSVEEAKDFIDRLDRIGGKKDGHTR